ncbi:MAG TPA: FKBP-type peptidyl-prolyl cis-trans isomerase [Acidobacteriaceae bacterium]|jgi:peptidylprolyl isomerase
MRTPAILIAFAATPLLAQTAQTTRTTHPATTAHHTTATATTGGCVRVPELSPKIPSLPPGSPCPKALYTITHHPAITLDYGSPLLNPEVRDILDQKPETFSLIYVDTQVGSGPLAQPHKWYTVHYTGYLPDGTKFDSSVDRGEPISFPYGGHRVIEGWDTGFEGMHVGGKRRLYVPYELGYGENGRPPIPPRSPLIFDVQLIAQSDAQPKPPAPPAANRPQPQPNTAKPAPEPGASSPAGSAAPPPVNGTTPSTSTQPAQPPTSTTPPKK